MKTKKKVLSVFLSLCMVFALMPTAVQAEGGITTQYELQNALNSGGTVTLTQDIVTTSALTVSYGTTVTLDLNGHTIDRGLGETSAVTDGYVIRVEGGLTVQDSVGGGKITGGNNKSHALDDSGGGVLVHKGTFTLKGGSISGNKTPENNGGGVMVFRGSLTIEGGEICGNTAGAPNYGAYGGGVMVYNGDFNMTGGSITGNSAESLGYGGGVMIQNNENAPSVNMAGGIIRGNNARSGGGVYIQYGHATMTGGTISDNSAVNCGGVYVYSDAGFTMTGGTIIRNQSKEYGAGVYSNGSFSVNGSPVIMGNVKDGTADNVYLPFGNKINVTGTLDRDAVIGVRNYSGSWFTDGLGEHAGSAVSFISDDSSYYVVMVSNGNNAEALLEYNANNTDSFTQVTDWAALESALREGGVVRLMNDISSPSSVTNYYYPEVPKDKAVTLDLNGHGIRYNKGYNSVVKVSGVLTLVDSDPGSQHYYTVNSLGRASVNDQGNGKPFKGGYITNDYGFSNEGSTYNGTAIIRVENTGTFNMNAGTILGTRNSDGGVNVKGMFNMSGGAILGIAGSGVYLEDNGVFKMYNGTIRENRTGMFGGGVMVDDKNTVFIMDGGTIGSSNSNDGNRAGSGGGVYVYSGTFKMNDGIIAGNTAAYGGGICLTEGSFHLNGGILQGNSVSGDSFAGGGCYIGNDGFKVSGTPVIYGNFGNGSPNNVFIKKGKVINVTGTLGHDAYVGVKTENAPGENAPIVITNGLPGKGMSYSFVSDHSQFSVTRNNEGEAQLVTHAHSFTYSADKSVITATCGTEGCGLMNNKIDLTLEKPLHTTFGDGKEAAAILTGLDAFNATTGKNISETEIEYYIDDTESQKLNVPPTQAGNYVAKITVEGKTAVLKYTIAKGSVGTPSVTMDDYTYGGTVSTPGVNSCSGGGSVTYYYNTTGDNEGGTEWKNISGTTLNADTYYIYAVIAETDNYQAYTTDTTEFEVSKASQPAPAAPTLDTATANSITLKTIENGEYRLGEGDWQNSPTFNGLEKTTEYSFYQRLKEDTNHDASPSSTEAKISTTDHTHNWTYSGAEDTITATCGNNDGGHGGSLTTSLTIEKPTLTVSNGSGSPEASLTGLDAFNAATGQAIETSNIRYYKARMTGNSYYKNGLALDAAPTEAGNYIAELSLTDVPVSSAQTGSVTASVGYTIARGYPLWVDNVQVTDTNHENVLKGDAQNDGKVSFTPASGSTPATLSLNGATLSNMHSGSTISSNLDESLTIKLTGENNITAPSGKACIDVNSKLTITSDGENAKLNLSGGSFGFYSDSEIIINGGTVSATGSTFGINAGSLTINGESADVTAAGNQGINAYKGDVTVSAGSLSATGTQFGIDSEKKTIITGGKVEAKGTGGSASFGLYASGVDISGGELTATGVQYGIYSSQGVTVTGGKVTAASTGESSRDWGIIAKGDIAVSGASTEVHATGNSQGQGMFSMDGTITITSPLAIVNPAGGVVGKNGDNKAYIAVSETNPAPATDVLIKAALITFDANGGTGNMDSVTVKPGSIYKLPGCGFTAPANKTFDKWQIGENTYDPDNEYTVTGDTIIKAKWKNLYTVLISKGNTILRSSETGNGAATQRVPENTAMTGVVYHAADGYYFPEGYVATYSVENSGVTVTRDSYSQITVSGTPAATVTVTLPAATAKTKMDTPSTVTFTANGPNSGVLDGFGSGTYRIDGKTSKGQDFMMHCAFVDENNNLPIDNIGAGDLTIVRVPVKDAEIATKTDSDAKTIAVSKAAVPNLKATQPSEQGGKGSIPTTKAHQFSTDGTNWSDCTGATTDLAEGTYYVRVAAAGTALASEPQEIQIKYTNNSGGGGGGSGGGDAEENKVNPPADPENGSVTVSPATAEEGQTVTITTKPDEGYKVEKVTVTDKKGNEIPVTDKGDGTYTFPMAATEVDVNVTFAPIQEDRPFTDVPKDAWFYDAVYHCYDSGYFKGLSDTIFGPNETMTRAMFATVLYRLEMEDRRLENTPHQSAALTASPRGEAEGVVEGSPVCSLQSVVFTDVEDGRWYTDAIVWAAENKIIEGYGDGKFGTNDPVTREQMVTIFWRYNDKPEGTGNLSGFSDSDKISPWAKDAFAWAFGAGVISGKGNGILDPTGTATRAEVAQIVTNYDQLGE